MSRGAALTTPAFEKHFRRLAREHGEVVILNLLGVNLVGSKEGEATLSTAFQTHQKVSPHTVLYCTVLYYTVPYCTVLY